MDEGEISSGQSRLKKVLFTFCGAVGIILVSVFVWRVFHFYHQIQSGVTAIESVRYEQSQASDARLREITAGAPGSGAIATSDDPSWGASEAEARVTIVEFADFGCPYSEEVSFVVEALARQFPNDIRVIYRDFPLVDLHPGADLAAQAGECAQEQGAFKAFHDELYRTAPEFTLDGLSGVAEKLDLNMWQFSTCLETGYYKDEVAQDIADGAALGVTGTPTFFVNGLKVEGAVPYSAFNRIVHAFIEE